MRLFTHYWVYETYLKKIERGTVEDRSKAIYHVNLLLLLSIITHDWRWVKGVPLKKEYDVMLIFVFIVDCD